MKRPWIYLAVAALAVAGCGGDGGGERKPGPPPAPGPAPKTAGSVRVGGSPSAVAAGLGAIWVADSLRGRLLRLDPRSEEVTARPRGGQGPVAVAVGEGSVWMADADGTVHRFEAATGAPSGNPQRVPGPGGIAVGEGSVWVTSQSGGTVTRLDPATGRRQGRPIKVGRQPTDVAVGGGAVWVANGAQMDGTVSRIDPGSGKADEPIDVVKQGKGQLFALTYGEGGVWVAGSSQPRGDRVDILRIDPKSSKVDDELVRLGRPGLPVRLAAGAGAVWAAQGGGFGPGGGADSGTVSRLDPAARRRVGSAARIAGSPTGISVGQGAVWLATGGDGSVDRIVPLTR